MVIDVVDEEDEDEIIGCIKVRVADHSQNTRNNRGQSCLTISFVIANTNPTESRFTPLGQEHYYTANDDVDKIKREIKDIIDDAIDDIKSKQYAKGGKLKVGDTVNWYGTEHKVKEIHWDKSKIGEGDGYGTMVLLSNGQWVGIAEVTSKMAKGGELTPKFKIGDKVRYEKWYYRLIDEWVGEVVGYKIVNNSQTNGEEAIKYKVKVERILMKDGWGVPPFKSDSIIKHDFKTPYRWVLESSLKESRAEMEKGGGIKTKYYNGALAFLNW